MCVQTWPNTDDSDNLFLLPKPNQTATESENNHLQGKKSYIAADCNLNYGDSPPIVPETFTALISV